MTKENKHTLLKVLGVTTVAAAYGGFSYTLFNKIFNVRSSKQEDFLPLFDEEKREWFEHSTKNDEFIDSYDGLKLHALTITNHPECHRWMILVPGYKKDLESLLPQLYEADHRDYNLLVLDNRGCGKSSGKYTGLGWNEHYDLISWVNYLCQLDDQAVIALYGVNVGANAVMNTLGDYLPSNVKCAVEDGGYADMKQLLCENIRQQCKVDGRLFIHAIDLCVKQTLHFSLHDISTKKQLSEAKIPVLFMHGNEDSIVPVSHVFDNYYACGSEKQLFTAENHGFETTYLAKDYYSVLFAFIEKYM